MTQKEHVYIVLSLKHALKKGRKDQWEAIETVEFVNVLRSKHYATGSVIGDYTNREILTGNRFGFKSFNAFEEYVHSKYAKQMADIDKAYGDGRVERQPDPEEPRMIKDQWGNERAWTVFDLSPPTEKDIDKLLTAFLARF